MIDDETPFAQHTAEKRRGLSPIADRPRPVRLFHVDRFDRYALPKQLLRGGGRQSPGSPQGDSPARRGQRSGQGAKVALRRCVMARVRRR